MKKKYVKSILTFFILSFVSCKAQQTYPLNTYPDDVPAGSYLKDLNNELNPYVGSWNASFNGKTINIIISKNEHHLFKRDLTTIFYQDALIVKFIVKNSSGLVLQNNSNTQSEVDRNFITSTSTRNNHVFLYYNGTNCGVGWGEIELKKLQANQISWSYRPNDTVLTTKNCPGNQDTTIYLPETKDLIFTKQ